LTAFERAEQYAAATRKPYFIALAIRGQSLSLSRLGQWERADSALQRFKDLTQQSGAGWSPEELRIARWELAQELHRRGQYRSGWQLVQELMREDLETRGPFSISSMGDHMLWLRYCITLGYQQNAADWLNQRRIALTADDPGLRTPDWTLLEAQVTSSLGEHSRALELLQRAEETSSKWPAGEVKDDLRVRIEVVRARLAVQAGDMELLRRAVSALAPKGGLTLSQAGERQRGRSYSQFSALAERLRGSIDSVHALAQAVSLTESALGPRHPEALAMKANLVLDQQERGSLPETESGLAKLARELGDELPAQHRILKLLSQAITGQQSAAQRPGTGPAEKTPLNRQSRPVIVPWTVG
jgi:tetratricopeptide (TPR) repeat protein